MKITQEEWDCLIEKGHDPEKRGFVLQRDLCESCYADPCICTSDYSFFKIGGTGEEHHADMTPTQAQECAQDIANRDGYGYWFIQDTDNSRYENRDGEAYPAVG